ncbi:hypothetical protein [Pseudalkalibacillus berkeleyi]|uniref:Uncharacterized protein n=1 Tax=Pseudalkalibacillus berkeleyi TaxID=1069813 RepID=A0ABS9H6Q8_9BACL|nr:hypothetical protein [Pseudalkalibacillus berkeleyi]MCF6139563.1 hypothetical protein [Pseudalkalibacillus berkeleyi]
MSSKGWTIVQWSSFGVSLLFILMIFLMTSEVQGDRLVLMHSTPWMYVLFGLSIVGYYFFVVAHICKRNKVEKITLRLAGQAFFWTAIFYWGLYIINQL